MTFCFYMSCANSLWRKNGMVVECWSWVQEILSSNTDSAECNALFLNIYSKWPYITRELAASAFGQPSTTCSTSLPSQHLPCLFSCRPHSWNSLPDFIWDLTISAECFGLFLKMYLFIRY